MTTQKCNKCDLFNHNLNENGICPNCAVVEGRTLCPICNVYFLRDGEPCSHNLEGLLVVKERELRQEEALRSIFPQKDDYSDHLYPIFHYYGSAYDGFGPSEEYHQHFNDYVENHSLCKYAVTKILALYHAMYGY